MGGAVPERDVAVSGGGEPGEPSVSVEVGGRGSGLRSSGEPSVCAADGGGRARRRVVF